MPLNSPDHVRTPRWASRQLTNACRSPRVVDACHLDNNRAPQRSQPISHDGLVADTVLDEDSQVTGNTPTCGSR
jgi:hypothetical protein